MVTCWVDRVTCGAVGNVLDSRGLQGGPLIRSAAREPQVPWLTGIRPMKGSKDKFSYVQAQRKFVLVPFRTAHCFHEHYTTTYFHWSFFIFLHFLKYSLQAPFSSFWKRGPDLNYNINFKKVLKYFNLYCIVDGIEF